MKFSVKNMVVKNKIHLNNRFRLTDLERYERFLGMVKRLTSSMEFKGGNGVTEFTYFPKLYSMSCGVEVVTPFTRVVSLSV